ncbi:hypothetical protein LY78DRAFT_651132 [Colletotrichum sublineola]|nr:hypothetical protein LY78DRAFT_651132 [Colletotrichum sublineola]
MQQVDPSVVPVRRVTILFTVFISQCMIIIVCLCDPTRDRLVLSISVRRVTHWTFGGGEDSGAKGVIGIVGGATIGRGEIKAKKLKLRARKA